MKIKTIIIGLGSAGAYDKFLDRKFSFGRNHLDCIKANKLFEIQGLIDLNKKKHQELHKKKKISKSLFSTKVSTFKKKKIDLVVIASPTETHRQNIKDCLCLNPSVIICEKPLTNNFKESLETLELLEKKKIKLIINYHRQFDSFFKRLGVYYVEKKFNKFIYKYNKGFMNNASHIIYFFVSLFGKIKDYKVLRKLETKKNINIDVLIYFKKNITLQLISFEKKKFDIFDIEAYSDDSKIETLNGGLNYEFKQKQRNKIFNNYSSLEKYKLTFPRYGDGFNNLYERVLCFFNKKDKLNDITYKKYKYFYEAINRIILNE